MSPPPTRPVPAPARPQPGRPRGCAPPGRVRGWLAAVVGAAALVLGGCGGSGGGDPVATTPVQPLRAQVLNSSLAQPWALAFLPDGRMLVTQRGGSMVLLSADGQTVSAPLAGVPAVDARGQGGLLDVALDPDFDLASHPWIYWTFAEPEGDLSGTAVARGRLALAGSGVVAGVSPGGLADVQVIYRQTPKVGGGNHYGSRLAFGLDKALFVTLGERAQDDPASPGNDHAQNLAKGLGKVVRLNRLDGSAAAGNPFATTAGALPEIWSLGHRNPQGAVVHPVSGELWVTEHGPQGGDELNRVLAGGNHGWPLRSHGCPYTVSFSSAAEAERCRVGGGTHAPAFTEPLATWTPKSVAPSGLAFYTGSRFPEWQGSLLMGALNSAVDSGYPQIQRGLWRLVLSGHTVTGREHLDLLNERVRDVRQGPDGWVYLLTDAGQLLRVER